MLPPLRRWAPWIATWLLLVAAGGVLLSRAELNNLREAFDTDMRIAHRLLSQRAVQHDAVLATLALLQPADPAAATEQRLPALYPQILAVRRRDAGTEWPDETLRRAERQSQGAHRAVLADADFANGRYLLLLAAEPASFALQMDLRAVVPTAEWPMARATSPVRVTLELDGQSYLVQPGTSDHAPWRFEFHKHLASDSQPFDVAALREVGLAELPWAGIAGWAVAVAAILAALFALQRQRDQRRRAEELLRLGQVGRLNSMGELAAGMAHELNQPLTAVMANAQAAQRLLDDEPPDLATARGAMAQAAQQARRAADVIGRLRRVVERPDAAGHRQPVLLQDAVRNALYLLEPETRRCAVDPQLEGDAAALQVMAEPVALEQIVHNLLMNALQALERVPAAERRLAIRMESAGGHGVLTVTDSGPGFASGELARLFEPFFSTRTGGLGLGLSLCETLATRMGGDLAAAPHSPRGAMFRLTLPLGTP